MRKVLLIGGTGAIGSYTALELSRRNIKVDVITLDDCKNNEYVTYYKLQYSYSAIVDFLRGRYYNAIVDYFHYSPESYPNTLALLSEHTEQLIFLSSYRVYSDLCHPIIESTPHLTDIYTAEELLSTEQSYPLWKSLDEKIIKNSKYRDKVTIVRPVISFYHGRLSYITLKAPNFIHRSGNKPILVPEEAKNIVAGFCFSGNVGKQIAYLVCNNAALGEDFTLGSNERLTWGEIAPMFEETLGSSFVWVDTETFLKYTTPDNVSEYYGLKNDRLLNRDVDISKVLTATGLTEGDFLSTYDAIKQEVSIILQDKGRYTVGLRDDIEANQDKYFSMEKKQ